MDRFGKRGLCAAAFVCVFGACSSNNGSGSNGNNGGVVAPPQNGSAQAQTPGAQGASASPGASAGIAGTSAPSATGTGGLPGSVPGGAAGAASMGTGGAPGTTSMGSAGAPATTPMSTMTDPSQCPAAPAGAAPEAVMALAAVNAVRVPAGSGCDNLVLTLDTSATNHCNYYSMNKSDMMCVADPHAEVMSCAGFTGANVGNRISAAGYTARGGYSEVMAFLGNPAGAVASWVNTVWHRIPILDPWTVDMGYGTASGCDTIDFGKGMPTAPANTIVVYPYNGQTNVPTSFNGSHEGPMPPAPSTGWPSSLPVNVYAQGIAVTDHVITVDGDTTPIDHVWLDTKTNTNTSVASFLRNTAFLYANKPFTANTKYRVKITGTYTGGALNLEWTFTTGAATPTFGH